MSLKIGRSAVRPRPWPLESLTNLGYEVLAAMGRFTTFHHRSIAKEPPLPELHGPVLLGEHHNDLIPEPLSAGTLKSKRTRRQEVVSHLGLTHPAI